MSRPIPKHGTSARYHRGCRCADCLRAHREYKRLHLRELRAGVPRMVPAGETIEHIDRLLSAGFTLNGIRRRAGLRRAVIYPIFHGKRPRIYRTTAEAILGVPLSGAPVADRSLVAAEPARALLREMGRHGIRRHEVARAMGLDAKSRPVGDGDRVSSIAYRRLVVLYLILTRAGRVPVRVDLEEMLL